MYRVAKKIKFSITILISILSFFCLLCFLLYPYNYVNAQPFNNPSYDDRFTEYYNSYTMIKFTYPSFWEKSETDNGNIISLVSPIKSIGVIIQHQLVQGQSLDEIVMNKLNTIKNQLSNVNIISINSSKSSNIFNLVFTYSNNQNTFMVLYKIKIIEDKIYTFIYYAEKDLFDNYLPFVLTIYDSIKIPNLVDLSQFKNSSDSDININNKINVKKNNNIHPLSIIKQNISSNIQNKSILYDNKSLGIKITYPVSFIKQERPNGILLESKGKNITAMVVNMPIGNISMNEFTQRQILSLNNTLENFYIVNSSISNLLGYPTNMIFFTYHNGTQIYQGLQFWKVVENHAHIFTYFTPSSRLFYDNLPIITNMINSLFIY